MYRLERRRQIINRDNTRPTIEFYKTHDTGWSFKMQFHEIFVIVENF